MNYELWSILLHFGLSSRGGETMSQWFSALRDRQAKADYLPGYRVYFITKEDIVAYLEATLEDGDPSLVIAALGDIARS